MSPPWLLGFLLNMSDVPFLCVKLDDRSNNQWGSVLPEYLWSIIEEIYSPWSDSREHVLIPKAGSINWK